MPVALARSAQQRRVCYRRRLMKYLLWLVMCAVVSPMGKDREIGVWGSFLAALFLGPAIVLTTTLATGQYIWGLLFLSPVILLVVLLATRPRARRKSAT